MVIELSWSVQFGVKSYARTRGSIWNHQYDIRPKLHDMKFNDHFITAILKSQNLFSTNIYLI